MGFLGVINEWEKDESNYSQPRPKVRNIFFVILPPNISFSSFVSSRGAIAPFVADPCIKL